MTWLFSSSPWSSSLMVTWYAISWAWSPKNSHLIKHNSQLLGFGYFLSWHWLQKCWQGMLGRCLISQSQYVQKLENTGRYGVLSENAMATYSSTLAWKIPGTAEPGELPSMGPHRVRLNWSDSAAAWCFMIFLFRSANGGCLCVLRILWYLD